MKTVISILVSLAFSLQALSETDQQDISQNNISQNLQICNETSFILNVSTAFKSEETEEYITNDNTEIYPGECINKEVLNIYLRYIYAKSKSIHQGGIREWRGNVQICNNIVSELKGVSKNCQDTNHESKFFRSIKPSESISYFIENENFKSKARTAGIQRLLSDNGYDINKIDGILGRKTIKALSKFKKLNRLENEIDKKLLMQKLAKMAKKESQKIGLTICNRTEAPIWTAIGTKNGKEISSRGWWNIKIDKCTQILNKKLNSKKTYYFARKESRDIMKLEKDKKYLDLISDKAFTKNFCISDSKFSAITDINCAISGYDDAQFRQTPADIAGLTITLTNNDF
jgi:uncharacterized membrane protein